MPPYRGFEQHYAQCHAELRLGMFGNYAFQMLVAVLVRPKSSVFEV